MMEPQLINIDVPCDDIDSMNNPSSVFKAEVYRRFTEEIITEEIITRKLPKPLFVTGMDHGKKPFMGSNGSVRWFYVSSFTFYYEVTTAGEIINRIFNSLTRKDSQTI